jgi:hypothetical protein
MDIIGQTVMFTYDQNGNRLTRSLVVEQLQSSSVSFPVINQKLLRSSTEFSKTKESAKGSSENETGKLKTLVYPNPTKGLIRIDISNMPKNSRNEIRLFDLSGNQLLIEKNSESYSEIDINSFKDGIYILRIKVNEQIFDWKVIKNN